MYEWGGRWKEGGTRQSAEDLRQSYILQSTVSGKRRPRWWRKTEQGKQWSASQSQGSSKNSYYMGHLKLLLNAAHPSKSVSKGST